MCELLEEIASVATVVRFAGFHNKIHRSLEFAKLYYSVTCSSDYYCLIDSDERLAWAKNATQLASSPEIISCIKNSNVGASRILPGLWLENIWLSDNRFKLYEGSVSWPCGLRTGKPILMATAKMPTVIGHNFQLELDAPEDVNCGKLIVLHLKNLYPDQRIMSNLNKLRQYGIIKNFTSDEDAMLHITNMDETEIASRNPKVWIREIKSINNQVGLSRQTNKLRTGEIELRADGAIIHANDKQRERFEDYLNDPGWFLSLALSGDTGRMPSRQKYELKTDSNSFYERAVFVNSTQINDNGVASPEPSEIVVGEIPSMSVGGLARFRELMRQATCYLEYGSGGSTRLATRYKVARVYSVESDPIYAKAVRRAVSWDMKKTIFKMVVPELGPTGPYGYPTDLSLCINWWRYPTQIWESIRADGANPDVVLVDGRFRVFCFLISLLNAKPGTIILFDDYSNRLNRYGEIESVIKPLALHDRMAEFKVPEEINFRLVSDLIAKYSCDRR